MKGTKILVKCLKSAKTGNLYVVMGALLSYRFLPLTMDKATIAEFSGFSFAQLSTMKENEVLEVCEVNLLCK